MNIGECFLHVFAHVNIGCLKVKLHNSLFKQFSTNFLAKRKLWDLRFLMVLLKIHLVLGGSNEIFFDQNVGAVYEWYLDCGKLFLK